jgi:hypothetical protein
MALALAVGAGVVAAVCGYVCRNEARLLANRGLRTFVRCVEGRAGVYMVLGRYCRKVGMAVVVMITFEDRFYALGLGLLINGVFFVIMAFYRPYKQTLQDYLNLLGEALLMLVLLIFSVLLNDTTASASSRLALGYAGIAFEALLLLQIFVQIIGLLVLFILSRVGPTDYLVDWLGVH